MITFDARNHGESEHHISMTYEAMTYDTLKLLEKLMIKRCVIIGHSMGGKTVMSTALRNPEFIEKLIVVDSAPKTSIAAGAAVTCLKAMMALDTDQVTTKRQANEALRDGIKVITILKKLVQEPSSFKNLQPEICNIYSFM